MATVEIQAPVLSLLSQSHLRLGINSSDRSVRQVVTPSRTPEPTFCPTSSSSGSSSSSCSGSVSPATPSAIAQSWATKPKVTQCRRKKASRACGHCQKAHLTCDDGRPCLRCEKRGLSATCRDGARKKAKYLRDYDDSLLVRHRPVGGDACGWPADLVWKSNDTKWETVNNNTGTTSVPGLTTDCFWDAQGNTVSFPGTKTITWGEDPFFGHVSSENLSGSIASLGAGMDNWFKGFDATGGGGSEISNSAKEWSDRMARELEIRKLAMHITLEDEEMVKRGTERSLVELERMISLSGTPTMVWSTLGEILKVGDEFCMLTERTRGQLVGKQVTDVFDSRSLTQYQNLVEKNAFEPHVRQVIVCFAEFFLDLCKY
ncbi:hypothetical protein BY996DRAFT_4579886 [Phakopsora pachyrhizi]|nr:hypothetical protein BY996DRAFT_4579886 [Phakopsora pachyrhizi]